MGQISFSTLDKSPEDNTCGGGGKAYKTLPLFAELSVLTSCISYAIEEYFVWLEQNTTPCGLVCVCNAI